MCFTALGRRRQCVCIKKKEILVSFLLSQERRCCLRVGTTGSLCRQSPDTQERLSTAAPTRTGSVEWLRLLLQGTKSLADHTTDDTSGLLRHRRFLKGSCVCVCACVCVAGGLVHACLSRLRATYLTRGVLLGRVLRLLLLGRVLLLLLGRRSVLLRRRGAVRLRRRRRAAVLRRRLLRVRLLLRRRRRAERRSWALLVRLVLLRR